jgi:hypothetical protein
MIFKIDGELGELLALTPIIREWKRRNSGEKVLIETFSPRVFQGNPDVDDVQTHIKDKGFFYDLGFARWRELGGTVAEVYADMILGDKNFKDWSQTFYCTQEDVEWANKNVPKTPFVAVGFDPQYVNKESSEEVVKALRESNCLCVNIDPSSDYGHMKAIIDKADLFVGSDGIQSAIAMTMNIPAVVCYSYRSLNYFPPFRKGIPFEAILVNKDLCNQSGACYMKHALGEFAKVYNLKCVSKNQFCCKSRSVADEVLKAIRKIGSRA